MIDSRAQAEDPVSPLLDERFLLLETLGRGGMGRVYRAFDRLDQRLVALKIVDQAPPADAAHQEFGAWSRLEHPNIVRAYEIARARRGPIPSGTPYLVLEHVPGRPVHRVLPPGRVDPALLAGFARKVLCALDHVHSAGLVHRDVKPGNVLVGTSRAARVKLTDFGLAARVGDRRPVGRISGSLPYVSPEAILGQPLDGRADLYGLGILLYFLATGRMPTSSTDPSEIVRWHLDGSTLAPRRFAPALPAPLARFIRSLTARSPRDRPASAPAALALLGGEASTASRTPRRLRGTADLARMRMAIDAVRLGARRVLTLPRSVGDARALVVETRALAHARGLEVHCVGGRRVDGSSTLARTVLQILLGRGRDAHGIVTRHGLLGGLPVEFPGGLLVWNRECVACGADRPSRVRTIARRLVALLLETTASRAMAIVFEREALADLLTREVALGLRRHLETSPLAPPGGRGLLLVLGGTADRSPVTES